MLALCLSARAAPRSRAVGREGLGNPCPEGWVFWVSVVRLPAYRHLRHSFWGWPGVESVSNGHARTSFFICSSTRNFFFF